MISISSCSLIGVKKIGDDGSLLVISQVGRERFLVAAEERIDGFLLVLLVIDFLKKKKKILIYILSSYAKAKMILKKSYF